MPLVNSVGDLYIQQALRFSFLMISRYTVSKIIALWLTRQRSFDDVIACNRLKTTRSRIRRWSPAHKLSTTKPVFIWRSESRFTEDFPLEFSMTKREYAAGSSVTFRSLRSFLGSRRDTVQSGDKRDQEWDHKIKRGDTQKCVTGRRTYARGGTDSVARSLHLKLS